MDCAEAGHLNRIKLLEMVNREIRPGAYKYCGVYGHLDRNCRNRMMEDFTWKEISSTSSWDDADESLIRHRNLAAANPDWRQEQEMIKKTYIKIDDADRMSQTKEKKKKKNMKNRRKKRKQKEKRKNKKKSSSGSSTSTNSNSISSDSSSCADSRRSSRRRKIKNPRVLKKYLGSEADVESMTEGVRYKMANRKRKDPI